MKLPLFFALATTLAAVIAMAEPVSRQKIEGILYLLSMNDVRDEDEAPPSFNGNFGCLAVAGEMPTAAIVSNLCAIALDYCNADLSTNRYQRLVYGQSLFNIREFCLPEASNTVEIVFSNATDSASFSAASAYVRLHGLGSNAFDIYHSLLLASNTVSREKACCLVNAVVDRSLANNASASVTNRVCWLCAESARLGVVEFIDPYFCKLWSGYDTSSNRLAYIDRRLSLPKNAGNTYLLNIRNQLLALPPGTMQMLPTNQFYNVED